MAKIKPSHQSRPRNSQNRDKDLLHTTNGAIKSKRRKKSIEELLTEATILLQQAQPDLALPIAEAALRRLESESQSQHAAQNSLSSTVCLLADIQIELGDVGSARVNFTRAVALDPEGHTIGAEAFLWLAQLSEEGGDHSIEYFEKASHILRLEVTALEDQTKSNAEEAALLAEKKMKLSDALCSMAEVYMTDLSLQEDAFVTEALIITPDSPSALQTLASVRISQLRNKDAESALRRSLEIWQDLPPNDEDIPDFPTRISLARLLMEVGLEEQAMGVLERLVAEDDQSVEAWYLGGWCQVLLSEKGGEAKKGARVWLRNSLRLYQVLEYEDERLRDHAQELVAALDSDLGVRDDGDDEWEDGDAGEEEETGEEGLLELGEEDADMT